MKPSIHVIALALSLGLPALVSGADRVWHAGEGHRWTALAVATNGHPGFTFLPASQTGIRFTNTLGEAAIAANRVLANGSGVAIGDYDNDGWPDIYFCALERGNVLYRNLGNWTFKEVTAEAGVTCEGAGSRGAVFADVNGDGWLDLLVSTLGDGTRCFLNDGHGKFTDATAAANTRGPFGSTTLALADVDGNGTLDLYVANYRPNDIRDRGQVSLNMVNGKPVVPAQYRNRLVFQNGQVQEYGQPHQLFLNDGAGHFREAAWNDGTFLDERGVKLAGPPLDWGLAASFRDVNGDGAPDLYVCNDYWTPDRFWLNDGHGHFRAIDPLALRKISSSSMAVDFADLDRDGRLDFFVVDMLSPDTRLRKRQHPGEVPVASITGVIDDRPQVLRNTLFRNRGDDTYEELADYAGIAASDWSWSAIFLDVDLDGYEDLLVGAGHFRNVQDMDAERVIRSRQHSWKGFKDEVARQQAFTKELQEHYQLYPLLKKPLHAYQNSGAWKFPERTEAWGLNQLAVHHGVAMGDLDQDGDLDFVVNNLNDGAGVYRNEAAAGRVLVQLKGRVPNTQGIGAKVTLVNGPVARQTTEIISGGRYLSGSEAVAMFATGSKPANLSLEVIWRNGAKSVLNDVQPNRLYEIEEKPSPPVARVPDAMAAPWFKDVSDRLAHTHPEIPFNDFERQPLLPFKLSQAGPGVAWFDLDGDGHEDLLIGAGRSGSLTAYRADGRGAFSLLARAEANIAPDDLAGLTGWVSPGGERQILAGVTGYETPGTPGAFGFRLQGSNLLTVPMDAAKTNNGGALALGDVDGTGQLALFVAGGAAPGRYPVGAPSHLYRHDGQRWQADARNSAFLDNLGIVNGAVWGDLDGDGMPELVLACGWGPVRVFQKKAGALTEITDSLGLGKYKGWWQGVTTGDFDGDGRLDLVAANWGLNSPYETSVDRPLVLAYGELFRPGTTDLIETAYDLVSGKPAPRQPFLALAEPMPFLYERFASHQAYSEATLDEVLGDRAVLSRRAEATTLASMVFLNRGDKFEAVELPRAAQLAPAFSVNVADFDGDGNEDIFLSQNFFATKAELPRLDAGRGLILKGDGAGRFAAVPGQVSGIKIYGEQRGAAVGDFNEDGRVDLVVSQNAAATKLYENTGATPGLRVRLKGPAGNPSGIGAVIRLQFGERLGPAREVHAGSGYWSQDGAVQVLATPGKATSVQVRWPSGKVTRLPLAGDTREVTVDIAGPVANP